MQQQKCNQNYNKPNAIFIALGANLPFDHQSPEQTIKACLGAIGAKGINVSECSGVFHSKAWPIGSNAPDYVNMVAKIEGYAGSPFELLNIINGIEKKFGRKRDKNNQNAPRTIDIDIIDFKGLIIEDYRASKSLILPHPRAHLRDFVLLPLKEIAPDWLHPKSKMPISALIAQLAAINDLNT